MNLFPSKIMCLHADIINKWNFFVCVCQITEQGKALEEKKSS